MNFLHYDLGKLYRGEIVQVTLSKGANVRLMSSSDFNNYKNGKKHSFTGGLAKRSPIRIEVPSFDYWYVVVDMQGLKGSTNASVQVIPGILPDLDKSPLPDIYSSLCNEPPPKATELSIFHFTEENDELIQPLADLLISKGVTVSYKETTLNSREPIREKIDKEIANTKVCILVLNSSFIKSDWTKGQLEHIVTLIESKDQILLPIWHNITKQQLVDFSSPFAKKVAISTVTHTIDELACELCELVESRS